MDGRLILAIGLLGWGGLLVLETAQQWRRDPEENLTWVDKRFLKLSGADKLPPTWFDRWLNRFRLVRKGITSLLMVIIGAFLILYFLDVV